MKSRLPSVPARDPSPGWPQETVKTLLVAVLLVLSHHIVVERHEIAVRGIRIIGLPSVFGVFLPAAEGHHRGASGGIEKFILFLHDRFDDGCRQLHFRDSLNRFGLFLGGLKRIRLANDHSLRLSILLLRLLARRRPKGEADKGHDCNGHCATLQEWVVVDPPAGDCFRTLSGNARFVFLSHGYPLLRAVAFHDALYRGDVVLVSGLMPTRS